MSNLDLARVILVAMWHLACMVVHFQNGDREHGKESQDEFMKLFNSLNEDA